MANRQRGRTPSDSRNPSGGRRSRTVPVSRSPGREAPLPGTPIYTEPEVRRWPHPLEDPAPAPEPALHYIRCALSYQNQLLADIKSLLERQAEDRAAGTPPAAEGANPEDNLSKL